MKPGIHPVWYPDAHVTCACGNTWTTGSTKKEIHTDVCNQCHPFFTGEQRIVDTAGQVERFMKRINAKEQIAATQPAMEEKKAKKEKRRERKAPAAAPVVTAPRAPVELPVAEIVEEKPIVAEAPALPMAAELPVVEETRLKVEEPTPVVATEPVVVEEIVAKAPAAEPPVSEAPVPETPAAMEEQVQPVVAEEPIQVVEEPIAVVETPTEVIVVDEVLAEEPALPEKKARSRAAKPAAKKTVVKKPAAKAKPKTEAKKPSAKASPTKKAKK